MAENVAIRDSDNVIVAFEHDDPAVTGRTNKTVVSIPENAHVEACYYVEPGAGETDGTVTMGLTLADEKEAARTALGALDAWSKQLSAEGVAHPAAEVAVGHDFLTYAHWGLYLVLNQSAYTAAQKAAFANNLAVGAADCTSPRQFFEKVHSLSAAQKPGADTPVVWVNPSDATRWNLADVVANSATEFGGSDWTDVTLDVSDIDIRSGAWIDNL